MLSSVWKNVPPWRRVAFALGGMAAGIAVVLLVTKKPWSWKFSPQYVWRVMDYVRVFSWWAGAANAALLAGLAATARWWMRPSENGLYDKAEAGRPTFPRLFWPAVVAVTLLSAVFGGMRLQHSFWDDEVYAMRRAIHGQWRDDTMGEPKFRKVRWTDTLWFFDKPQHVFHSVITRLTLDTWRAIAKPKGLQFREDVARFPSYVAGVLSITALAVLVWRMGFPVAGVLAALLMAIHPWHIRYASELRAYSMMLLLLPLCYWFLIEALTNGRWRWWWAFGAGVFVLMYANALNIYPVAGMGLCAVAAVAMRYRNPEAPTQAMRLMVVMVAAGMVFLQLMLPCVPQFVEYLHTTAVQGKLDGRWLSSYFGLLFAGAPWNSSGQPVSTYMELHPWAAAHPAKFLALAVGTFLFAAYGMRRLLLKGPLQATVALALLLTAPVAYMVSRVRHQYLFEWYLLFLLPGVILAVAVGLDGFRLFLTRNFPRAHAGSILAWLLIAGAVGSYAAYTTPQRTWLLTRPLQQIRESALVTRSDLNPFTKDNEKILTASFIGPPDPYDARIIRFSSIRELKNLMNLADREHKTLFINFGFLGTVHLRFPATLKLLSDHSLFENTASLQGYEPINDRFVYRYIPGSITGRDLSSEIELNPVEKMVEDRYDAMEASKPSQGEP